MIRSNQERFSMGHLLFVAWYFAWGDIRGRYARTTLGPLWLVVGTAVGISVLGIVWGGILDAEAATYLPSLGIGIILWQFITASIIGSTSVLTQNRLAVRNIRLPCFFYPVQTLFYHVITLLHQLLVIIVLLVISPPEFSYIQLLIVPGVLLMMGNLFWIMQVIAIVSARFHDFGALVAVVMPVMFFLTPIIYRPTDLGLRAYLIWLNPFTYMISLVRDPLLGAPPPLHVFIVSGIVLSLGSVFTLWLVRKRERYLPFWV